MISMETNNWRTNKVKNKQKEAEDDDFFLFLNVDLCFRDSYLTFYILFFFIHLYNHPLIMPLAWTADPTGFPARFSGWPSYPSSWHRDRRYNFHTPLANPHPALTGPLKPQIGPQIPQLITSALISLKMILRSHWWALTHLCRDSLAFRPPRLIALWLAIEFS